MGSAKRKVRQAESIMMWLSKTCGGLHPMAQEGLGYLEVCRAVRATLKQELERLSKRLAEEQLQPDKAGGKTGEVMVEDESCCKKEDGVMSVNDAIDAISAANSVLA